MSKNEFLPELKRPLQELPLEEQEHAPVYYEEYLSEAGPDNETRALQELGSPATAAARIVDEYAAQAPSKPEKKKRFAPVTFLAVCAAPLALPLAIGMLALIISICAVFLSLGIATAALPIAGLISMSTGIFIGYKSIGSGIFYIGYGILLCAIGIPCVRIIWRLSQTTWERMQLSFRRALIKKGGKGK